MKAKVNWDAMGIVTSLACAVHCAILPLLVSAFPLFGINILHNAFFEWGMIGLAFIIGVLTLLHGYRKHHQSLTPVLIFSTGFLFLLLKQFLPSMEYWFLAFAVMGIVSAHLYNFRLCRKYHASA